MIPIFTLSIIDEIATKIHKTPQKINQLFLIIIASFVNPFLWLYFLGRALFGSILKLFRSPLSLCATSNGSCVPVFGAENFDGNHPVVTDFIESLFDFPNRQIPVPG
jgi:hypothetical protein